MKQQSNRFIESKVPQFVCDSKPELKHSNMNICNHFHPSIWPNQKGHTSTIPSKRAVKSPFPNIERKNFHKNVHLNRIAIKRGTEKVTQTCDSNSEQQIS